MDTARLGRLAEGLVARGAFLTADALVAEAGGPFAVPGMRALPPMAPREALPRVVQHLFDVQRRLDAFVACFFMHRPVATLSDLETEAVRLLNAAMVPRLACVVHGAAACQPSRDPGEIQLDEEGPQEPPGDRVEDLLWPPPTRFDQFGLGPLHKHPLVAPVFPAAPTERFLALADLLPLLVSFTGDAEAFRARIMRQYGVSGDPAVELGVFVAPGSSGCELFRALRQRAEHEAAQVQQQAEREETSRPRKRPRAAAGSFGAVPKLAAREDSPGSALARECEQALETAFSPSFSKLRKVVEAKFPKRERVLDILTEHLMLHLGSSKYRAKRFEKVPEQPGDDMEGGGEASEAAESPKAPPPPSPDSAAPAAPPSPVPAPARPPARLGHEVALPHLRTDSVCRYIGNAELRPFAPSVQGLNTGRQIGRWGEALVYNYLRGTLTEEWSIKWMNEKEESLASYDLYVFDERNKSYRSSRFVEVKSSRYDDKNAFELSLNEWEFFTGRGGGAINYDIYRVYNAGDPLRVFIAVVEDPLKLIREQRLHLCLAL